MRRFILQGTYYELGWNLGHKLQAMKFRIPGISAERHEFYRECEAEVERSFPEIVEWMQGLSDGMNVDRDAAAAFILTAGVGAHGCTVFASTRTKTGEPIVGRNFDASYSSAPYCWIYMMSPNSGLKSLANSETIGMSDDGVNEAGLFVGVTCVATEVKPGAHVSLLVRGVLEKCFTVEEGIHYLLDSTPLEGANYLLADASGKMAVVEASPNASRVRWPIDDWIVTTNHFVHPEMQSQEKLSGRWADSEIRLREISNQLMKAEIVTVEMCKNILSSHDHSICCHEDEEQIGTLWSLVATPRSRRFLLASGHPCSKPYIAQNQLSRSISI